MLSYRVDRGEETGIVLSPHRNKRGMFVASDGKFGRRYEVTTEEELIRHLKLGRSIRMSNMDSKNHRAPSLISPSSIQGWKSH